MKAIVYDDYGSPDVLRYADVDVPAIGDDDVLISVRAASLNPIDWHFMRGTPYVLRLKAGLTKPKKTRLGVDVAGVVEARGRNVTRFEPGDEVFGTAEGAFAELARASAAHLVTKPANVAFEQAAAVPTAALTALQGLRDKGRLRAGQTVLINGAAGGVGTTAIQVARILGARVTGVCSARNVDLVRSLGAADVINYTKADFTRVGAHYDVVFDTIGNHSLLSCRDVLQEAGTCVIVGGRSGRWIGPLGRAARAAVLSRLVRQTFVAFLAQSRTEDLVTVRDLIAGGKLTPTIDRRYRLADVPNAIRYLEQGHARGKIVVTMNDPVR
jgi:NADPH:quinone reductase-like Zn-dependent oxidoreductase